MKNLPDKSIDCFMCDLPYGITDCDWDTPIDLQGFWEQVRRLCKTKNTPVLMFCNTKFGYSLIQSNSKWYRYDLVWNKERGVNFLLANKMPMKSHEMIYVFSEGGAFYKRIDISGDFPSFKPYISPRNKAKIYATVGYNTVGNDGTHRCPLSVINIRKQNTLGHNTEKPKELYEWLLKRYCPDGGTVLDPTAGSFNSIMVAKSLGLKGIGIEKDRDIYWKGVGKVV